MSEIPQRLIDKAFRIHDKIDGVRDEATYIAVIAQALDEERRDWFDSMSALSSFFGCGLGEDYHTAQQMYDRVLWGVNYRDERTEERLEKRDAEIGRLKEALKLADEAITLTECPRPINHEMAVDCHKAGECGCCYSGALDALTTVGAHSSHSPSVEMEGSTS